MDSQDADNLLMPREADNLLMPREADNLLMPRECVMPWAEVLRRRLEPGCKRIEIAGSLRRGKAEVKDIEIVAIPRPAQDLFGPAGDGPTELDRLLDYYVRDEMLAWDTQVKRNGQRYKRLISTALELPVDLFLADGDNWGNIMALRTGCAEFSKALVTRRSFGGLMPEDLFHRDGYVWITKNYPGNRKMEERLCCPTEEHYFGVMDLPCLPPQNRTKAAVNDLRRRLGQFVGGRYESSYYESSYYESSYYESSYYESSYYEPA